MLLPGKLVGSSVHWVAKSQTWLSDFNFTFQRLKAWLIPQEDYEKRLQDVIYATALERHHSKVGQNIRGLQEKKELISHQCLSVLRGILIDWQKKIWNNIYRYGGFPDGWDGKESAWNSGDPGLIPGSRRSPGVGTGNQLRYSCLENSMDKGTWRTTVHAVTKIWTRLWD